MSQPGNKPRDVHGVVRAGRRLVLAALVGLSGVASASEERGCFPVLGQLVTSRTECPAKFSSPLGLCTAGQLTLGRHLVGTTRFRALAAASGAGQPLDLTQATTLSYAGELEVSTPLGNLLVADQGLSDFANLLFTELGVIQGARSTEHFQGASGTLFVSGVLTPDGMTFSGTVTGQLCVR